MNAAFVCLLVTATLCISCSASYEGDAPKTRVATDAKIYVGMCGDAQFEGKRYPLSGEITTKAIVAALSEHTKNVHSAPSAASRTRSVTAAHLKGADYLIQPTIVHWEEHNTQWSGKEDMLTVKLELVQVPSGETLDTLEFKGKSKWATFGGDSVRDLLPKPLEHYAKALFSN